MSINHRYIQLVTFCNNSRSWYFVSFRGFLDPIRVPCQTKRTSRGTLAYCSTSYCLCRLREKQCWNLHCVMVSGTYRTLYENLKLGNVIIIS